MSYLNSKYERYADRLQTLIDEGQRISKLPQPVHTRVGKLHRISAEDQRLVQSWAGRSQNIVEVMFGIDGVHRKGVDAIIAVKIPREPETIYQVIGILEGALDDLRNGFLTRQEFLIGNEAAHGNFNAYTEQSVTDMLDGIERFLAQELQ